MPPRGQPLSRFRPGPGVLMSQASPGRWCRLPAQPGAGAFRLLSAHAESVTLLALACAALAGGALALLRAVAGGSGGRSRAGL